MINTVRFIILFIYVYNGLEHKMAEGVVIEQFGPGVPKWIIDKTVNDILSTLEEIRDLNKDMKKSLASKVKGAAAGNKDDYKELQDAINDTEASLDNLSDSADNASDDIDDLGRSSKRTSSILSGALSAAVNGLAYGLGVLTSALTKQFQIAIDLNKAGVNLTSGVDGVATGMGTFGFMAKEINLTFGEMADVVKNNAAVMSQYGTLNFTRVMKGVNENMAQFGLTNREGAELLTTYLEAQRQTGLLQRISDQQQLAMTKTAIESTARWARVLGKSREEIEKQSAEAQKSAMAQSYLRSATASQVLAYEEAAKALGPNAEFLLKAVSSPITEATDEYKEILASGGGAAAAAFKNATEAIRSGADPEIIRARLQELSDAMPNDEMVRTKAQFGVIGMETLGFTNRLKVLNEQMDANNKVNRDVLIAEAKQAKAAGDVGRAYTATTELFNRSINGIFKNDVAIKHLTDIMSAVSNAIEENMTDLSDVFGDVAGIIVAEVGPVLKGFAIWLKSSSEEFRIWLNEFKNSAGEFDFGAMLSDMGSRFMDSVLPDLGKALAIGVGALFASKLVISAVTAGLGKLFTGALGGGNAGASSKSGGKAGALGGALQGVTGGLLSGIATGLEAFGKGGPAIIKGAGVIAIVIPLIGAAVAGATWIMGKALPTFAEGMKAFEDLNGDNLSKVGEGIKNIGLGIAAFGAGGVLNVWASIGEIFTDSPLEKLAKFGEIEDSVLNKISKLSQTLAVFAPSFSSFADSMSKDMNFDVKDAFKQFKYFDERELGKFGKIDQAVFDNMHELSDSLAYLTPNFKAFAKVLSLDVNLDIEDALDILGDINQRDLRGFDKFSDKYITNVEKMSAVTNRFGDAILRLPKSAVTIKTVANTTQQNISKIASPQNLARIRENVSSPLMLPEKTKAANTKTATNDTNTKPEKNTLNANLELNTLMKEQTDLLRQMNGKLDALYGVSKRTGRSIKDGMEGF